VSVEKLGVKYRGESVFADSFWVVEKTSFLYKTALRRIGKHELMQRHLQYMIPVKNV